MITNILMYGLITLSQPSMNFIDNYIQNTTCEQRLDMIHDSLMLFQSFYLIYLDVYPCTKKYVNLNDYTVYYKRDAYIYMYNVNGKEYNDYYSFKAGEKYTMYSYEGNNLAKIFVDNNLYDVMYVSTCLLNTLVYYNIKDDGLRDWSMFILNVAEICMIYNWCESYQIPDVNFKAVLYCQTF